MGAVLPRPPIRIESADGRTWTVTIRRTSVRWRHFDDGDEMVLWPITSVVLPMVVGVLELSAALVRAPFSRTRWVHARCAWPSELELVWETSRDRAADVAHQVAEQLAEGYDALAPEGARMVRASRLPGAP
jgi:hypothetical protein